MPYKNLEDKRAYDRAQSSAKYARRKATGKRCAKCSAPLWARGLCNTHYAAQKRAEDEQGRIKAVRRATQLMKSYGLTEADYDVMLAAQGDACAICRSTSTGSSRTKYFHVDHDHVRGTVRGLLCAKCNTAVGLLDDSVENLLAAAEYLRRSAA